MRAPWLTRAWVTRQNGKRVGPSSQGAEPDRETRQPATGRRRARDLRDSGSAGKIAALHLRLRPHQHRQNRGGGESSGREPTKSGAHKTHTSSIDLYQIEPFA